MIAEGSVPSDAADGLSLLQIEPGEPQVERRIDVHRPFLPASRRQRSVHSDSFVLQQPVDPCGIDGAVERIRLRKILPAHPRIHRIEQWYQTAVVI